MWIDLYFKTIKIKYKIMYNLCLLVKFQIQCSTFFFWNCCVYKHTRWHLEKIWQNANGILLRGCHGVFIFQILKITLSSYNYLPFKILESGVVVQTYNPSIQGVRQEDCALKGSLSYMWSVCLKNSKQMSLSSIQFCYYLNKNLAKISFNLLFLFFLTKY